jgi:hypothetical protein
MEGVRTWVTVVRDEASLPRLCATPSGGWSVVEERSGVTGTPFWIARGVAAPSIAWSSELLTGRKEAMMAT